MICPWRGKIESYVDSELPQTEMAQLEDHLRTCPSCAADALARVQMKRAISAAASNAFSPTTGFHLKVARSVSDRKRARVFWLPQITLAAAMVLAIALGLGLWARYAQQRDIVAEITDIHVSTLASANPVDVISTDRHTVKPWFEGKLPFTFDLPELQNSEFHLIGGRVVYIDQSPGAHLLFGAGKHQISVFVFQDRGNLANLRMASSRKLAFHVETWSEGGLRYLVISDASEQTVHALSSLIRSSVSTRTGP